MTAGAPGMQDLQPYCLLLHPNNVDTHLTSNRWANLLAFVVEKKMSSTLSSRSILWCTGLLLALWSADVQAAKGSFEETYPVSGPFLLDVKTGSGKIEIRAGTDGEIRVKGKISVGSGWFGGSRENAREIVEELQASPPVEIEDGRVRIGYIKERRLSRKVSISYDIVVPANTQVKSHTGSGSQSISGVAGPVEVGSGSGRLTLSDIGGSVNASAGSGSISAEGVAGAFDAHTGSGAIRLIQVAPGDVEATAGSGSIDLKGVVGALRARSGSGSINVDGQMAGPWDLDTGSGSVHVTLPTDAAFTLDAESNSSSITVDHPVTIQGKMSKKRVKGDVRGGGEMLRIETGSGRIRVE